jgi:hypothetical protein
MHNPLKKIICAIAAGFFLTGHSASACGPDFESAVTINGKHPDLPLKLFAKGNLGVIQGSWAQSYMIVVYRYLSNAPLNSAEQQSIVQLWHQRLRKQNWARTPDDSPDPVVKYFALRAGVLGLAFRSDTSKWELQYECGSDNAFEYATGNLQQLIKKYGMSAQPVVTWVKRQDKLFGISAKEGKTTAAAKPVTDKSLQSQQLYQAAAGLFYSNDMQGATKLFEQLAQQGGLPWRDLAWYMAARSTITGAIDTGQRADCNRALEYVKLLIARSAASVYLNDLYDLQQLISSKVIPFPERTDAVFKSVVKPGTHFGTDVSTITTLLEESLPDYTGMPDASVTSGNTPSDTDPNEHLKPGDVLKRDLTAWLSAMQEPDTRWWSDEEKAIWESQRKQNLDLALKRWRQTKALTWLVACLQHDAASKKTNSDVLAAAEKLPPTSPAYLTARFYLNDALIQTGQIEKARSNIAGILVRKDVPPTARNLLMTQSLPIAKTASEYLSDVAQHGLAITRQTDSTQLPSKWKNVEQGNCFYTTAKMVACEAADDLNVNLPQARWLEWAMDKSIEPTLHAQVVRAAWLRSKVINYQSAQLDDEMARLYPSIRRDMQRYQEARDLTEKRFLLAFLILNNEGMSPYIHGGVERHNAKINQFDDFNANFWLPYTTKNPAKNLQELESSKPWEDSTQNSVSPAISKLIQDYGRTALAKVLSKTEQEQAMRERQIIWDNHPSRFLGEAVLARAKSHPKDPLVPEALYKVVKLPKWSARSDVGSKYSKEAYVLLHKRYPSNQWSKKAVCWY